MSVASVPPPGATFDELWLKELKNDVAPPFDLPSRPEEGEGDLIDAGQFMEPFGNFFNFGAVHLVTTSTTRRLTELAPGSRFDAHRFRPNIVIDTDGDGFVETDWAGRKLNIGDVHLDVSFTVPRCVMTTLEQDDLPADQGVLRADLRAQPGRLLRDWDAVPVRRCLRRCRNGRRHRRRPPRHARLAQRRVGLWLAAADEVDHDLGQLRAAVLLQEVTAAGDRGVGLALRRRRCG